MNRPYTVGARGLATAALLAGMGAGCAIEPPAAPSTLFTLNIPISSDTTHVSKITEDREFLKIDPTSGGMALNFSREVGRAEVGERLSLRPQELAVETAIGPIEFPGVAFDLPPIALSTLVGRDLPAGTVPLIPGGEIRTSVDVPLEQLQSLVVQEGGLQLTLGNETPITLTDMALTLIDRGRGDAVVAKAVLGTIGPGASALGVLDLSGKDISGNLTVEVTGRSQEATNATVSDDDRLVVTGGMTDLVLLAVEGFIPPQEFAESQAITFPDDRVQVTTARIQDGKLTLRVTSGIVLLTQMRLQLDDLTKPDGSVNVFDIELEQGASEEIVFDLAENDFTPIDPLELRFSYTAHTVGAQTPARLEVGQVITVEVLTEPLILSRVEGRLNGLSLPIPEVEREVEFPDGLNNISLAGAGLDIYFTSRVGFLAEVNLVIRGINKFGQEGRVDVTQRFQRENAADTVFSTQASVAPDELTPFINLLPSQLFIETDVRIGDGRQVEVIEPTHWVSIDSIVFHTSPQLTIEDSTYIDVEPRDIGFRDRRTRERIETNYCEAADPRCGGEDGAAIHTILDNSMPIGVGVRLFAAPRKEDVFTNPVVTVPRLERRPFRVDPAPVDAQGHSAGVSHLEPVPYILDKDRVLQFLQDPLYSGVRIYLPESAGQVELLNTDWLYVQSNLEIKLVLDENLVKD